MRANTSGARLEPPIPRSTTVDMPAERTSAAKVSNPLTSGCMTSGRTSHPNRFPGSSSPGAQADGSLSQIRVTSEASASGAPPAGAPCCLQFLSHALHATQVAQRLTLGPPQAET